jgi:quercetin dioxygenase-like cupin family protein
MAAGLSLYHLDAQPIEQVSPLIQRQYLHGSQSTFTKWIMKKGAGVPLHHHANEQITWITQGEAEVYSQGKKYVMHAGDIMIIPPNVPHEFWFTQDTIDIDIFSPQRQDWMTGRQTTSRRNRLLAVAQPSLTMEIDTGFPSTHPRTRVAHHGLLGFHQVDSSPNEIRAPSPGESRRS